jgi:hypothetical protein
MRTDVLGRSAVKDLLRKFVVANLYTDRSRDDDRQNASLLQAYGAAQTPVFLILGPEGRERARTEGFVGEKAFLEFLSRGLPAERPK